MNRTAIIKIFTTILNKNKKLVAMLSIKFEYSVLMIAN